MPLITAGIVTYEPDVSAVEQLVKKLGDCDSEILLIDNGSSNSDALADRFGEHPGVRLYLLEKNLGLAAAINVACQRALENGSRYTMAIDQDSLLQDDHLRRMIDTFEDARARAPRLAALGACVYDIHQQRELPFKTFGAHPAGKRPELPTRFSHADFLITSGTLLSTDALRSIGLMNEWLFIDSVDLDWCFRARAEGWLLLGTTSTHIRQNIGHSTLRPSGFLGKFRVHNPGRYYTMTRNRRFLYKQSYTPGIWSIKDSVRAVVKYLVLMLFSIDRAEISRAHWKGLRASTNNSEMTDPNP